MREGWKVVRLHDCLEKTPKVKKIPKKHFLNKGRFPIVSQEKDLVNGYWEDESALLRIDKPVVVFGDHTQVVKLINFDFAIGADGVKILKPKDFLDGGYLFYYLQGNPVQSLGYARHFRLLREIKVCYPPLPEQKRIVAILDEAFAGIDKAIANTEKNLANARELFESYLESVFSQRDEGWTTMSLGDCFRLKSGDGLTSKKMIPGDYSVYGGNGVIGTHNDFNLTGDNVIVGRVGALCGNARNIKESIWLTDNAFKIVDKKQPFDNIFLTYLLNYKQLRKYARQSAQPVISNSSLKDIALQFPVSVSEQKVIVRDLDAFQGDLNRIKSIYQQKLQALQELKQSLLSKAFSGELTAKDTQQAVEAAA